MKSIVLIDDSAVVLKAAERVLKKAGYHVKTCINPEKFREIVQSPPDLMLVDVNMPEMYGDDTVQFFREEWKVSSPIYLWSGVSEDELQVRAKESGANGYICKAWGLEGLTRRVKEILDGE